MSDCKSYLRHDPTTSAAVIRLPARYWAIIEKRQAELADELNVKRVARPLALLNILESYRDSH
ncbi:hypothetical protein IOQ59_07505 [Pontibacterium sp. N1Y112]|uniref:Uncharacterized protein n=1 Tax=Pontibacterium sinense TaxID=2781979 RepID=A0A8J7K6M2_9GAMM|nr:hypothetical protein [Pontibacterium sinense]MBE9397106.1 hypothetical protein [Pontibacterium sinense]